MTDFTLSVEERNVNPLWKRILAHLTEQRDILRSRNDGALDAIETAHLRGRIQQLNALIALDADKPDIQPEHFDKF